MYETVSIIFSNLADATILLLILLIISLFCHFFGRYKLGLVSGGLATVGFLVIAILPIGTLLIAPLENRFAHAQPLPQTIDGIVVLGGAIDLGTSISRGQPSLNANADRLVTFASLANRYPESRLIYTGGYRSLNSPLIKENEIASTLLLSLGIDPERLTTDGASRNTRDNAFRSILLAKPDPNENWLLITSARHMPRAIGAFRHAGWYNIIPYPVDYLTKIYTPIRFRLNLLNGLRMLKAAQHEWIGLAVYRMMGYSDELFPKP